MSAPSADSKNEQSEDQSQSATAESANQRALPAGLPSRYADYDRKALQDSSQLPAWVALAIAMMETYGLTMRQVCEQIRGGKGIESVRKYRQSPAGKAWIAKVQEQLTDPELVVAALIRLDGVQALADHMLARQWAREARDYRAMHHMTKDVTLKPVLDKFESERGVQSITVNIGHGQALETAPVEVDYEVVETSDEEEA